MQTEERFDLDDTGKIRIDDIYNSPDPRKYFSTLKTMSYQIPENAKPVFQQLIRHYRKLSGKQTVRILDIGCSYGVNAMMLRCNLDMNDLYRLYASEEAADLEYDELVERDQEFLTSNIKDPDLKFIGLDKSANAVDYAVRANILDAGADGDLESDPPSRAAIQVLDHADIIISTGCIGYVTANTLKWILKINSPKKPWMANLVLRMFPFDEIDRDLQNFGYTTNKLESRTFLQRQFAGRTEQKQVLRRLDELEISTENLEAKGWFHAEAFISLPDSA